MKANNKMRLALAATTLVALMTLASTPVSANGAYGSGVVLAVVDEEVHETVDAGAVDLIPQVITSLVAISGFVTTSVLIKKTK